MNIPEAERLMDWLRASGLYAEITKRVLKSGELSYKVTLKWTNGRVMRLSVRDGWRWLEGEIVKTVCLFDDTVQPPEWAS